MVVHKSKIPLLAKKKSSPGGTVGIGQGLVEHLWLEVSSKQQKTREFH